MHLLDIGEVAARAGVAPSTLRYYEEIGLIASVSRHGLRRQFGPEVLLQLKLIALGKMAGFPLETIGAMFGSAGGFELPRDRLLDKAEAIDLQVRELAALAETLRHIARCKAPSHLECPSFRKLLAAAGRDETPGKGNRRFSAERV
ncbi:helix-turn-helix domain-containing protein [Kaistia geumhonensis]|uniref:DNA-binding transcriptional MerR regulator n=1 Tax=Kaistia geumhonensis TaxID=410839 RepID=A0ABU0M6I0_9HYPH|nr:helix-turn-helix domain-containing protein [Kaistia geumhonensis]MCX5478218.1 helix-turn-helix domain-containing protein [Kaistia geumhonensis]MDQ0516566.1 DNA-binding transcriptional MerR regulator [Kaistia geumhonensis]